MKRADHQCTCGHPREMHEHYRAGSDCGRCGFDGCARFHRMSWWSRRTSVPVPDAPVADLTEYARHKARPELVGSGARRAG